MDIEQKRRYLTSIGYWPVLAAVASGWQCTLYNGVRPQWNPPIGDGLTAMEAIDNADAERVRMEGKR